MATPRQTTFGTQAVPPKPTRPRRQLPAWAFWVVVVIAIVLGILAGVLWFFLQSCRAGYFDPATRNSICPTILPQTCSKADSSGNPICPPVCKVSCSTPADCPSYAPNCVNSVCST